MNVVDQLVFFKGESIIMVSDTLGKPHEVQLYHLLGTINKLRLGGGSAN